MSDAVTDHFARAAISTHEKVCTERYGNLWTSVQSMKKDLDEIKTASRHDATIIHDRFNTISNRMWLAVAGVAASAVLGLASVVFYLIMRSMR